MDFFERAQGAAIFKHAVLQRYVPIFVNKVGMRSRGNRVAILDGFAGPGFYDDGTLGSPAVAMETARTFEDTRNVCLYFVEESAAEFTDLSVMVSASDMSDRIKLRYGDVDTLLPEIMTEIGVDPLFAFLDPFGLGIAFGNLIENIMRRPSSGGRRGPTEILVNFVHAGVYRNAGKLTIDTDDRVQLESGATIVELVDKNMGGQWWRSIWLGEGTTSEKVGVIRLEYVRRVLEAAGPSWRCYGVPVADVWKGKTIYDLLLFTQHDQGPWFFNEAVSGARTVFQDHCAPELADLPQLWDPADELRDIIAENLKSELEKGRTVSLVRQYELVYGDTLGYARATHVRKAIKKLYQEGVTSTPGIGELHTMVVKPA